MHTSSDHDHDRDDNQNNNHHTLGGENNSGNGANSFDIKVQLPNFSLNVDGHTINLNGASLEFEGTAKLGQNGHDVIHLTEIEINGVTGVSSELNLLPHPITITGSAAELLVDLAHQFGTTGHSV